MQALRAAEMGEQRYDGRLHDAAREDSRLAARLDELAAHVEEFSTDAGNTLTDVQLCAA